MNLCLLRGSGACSRREFGGCFKRQGLCLKMTPQHHVTATLKKALDRGKVTKQTAIRVSKKSKISYKVEWPVRKTTPWN